MLSGTYISGSFDRKGIGSISVSGIFIGRNQPVIKVIFSINFSRYEFPVFKRCIMRSTMKSMSIIFIKR